MNAIWAARISSYEGAVLGERTHHPNGGEMKREILGHGSDNVQRVHTGRDFTTAKSPHIRPLSALLLLRGGRAP